MKTVIFFLLFCFSFVTHVNATVLAEDTFTNGSLDGWGGDGYTYQNDGWMYINRDKTAKKTYTFSNTYANQTLQVTFRYWVPNTWESSGDRVEVYRYNTKIKNYYNGGGYKTETFTLNLNSNAEAQLKFKPNTNKNNEYMAIDYVKIESQNTSIIENANDICYGGIEGGCTFFIFACNTSIPINNISKNNLSDTKVYLDTSGFGSFLSDCSVDNGPSGVDCQNKSNFQFGPATIFGKTTEYTLGNKLTTNDANHSVQQSALFDMTTLTNIYATYTKNGVLYRGKLQQCGTTQSTTVGERDFILRHQENLYGDVKVIGNSVLCKKNSAGECVESGNNISNAEVNLQKTPQSSAVLDIPQNAVVKYARVYWQGRKAATSTNSAWDESSKTAASTLFIKKDGGSFTEVTADILDIASTNSGNYVKIYHASADVSSIVTGSGTYSVDSSSFYTNTGETWTTSPYDGLGNYGAWTLVVVYEDSNTQTARSISIFDGYKIVTSSSGNVDISTSGFLTPKANNVDAKLYIFAAEGDKYITGDHLKMAGLTNNTTLTDIAPTTNNAFDSRIDITTNRTPSLTNNNGIDIQEYDVGTNGKNIITNDETGAKFQFTSTQDTYFPSLVVFSTQLYSPNICYDYTYGQNAAFLTAPNVTNPSIDGTFNTNTPINVKLYFQNQENSDITISNLKVNIDPIDIQKAAYHPNSVYVTPPGGTKTFVSDTNIDAVSPTGSYLQGIPVGNGYFGSLDYFYTYYSLDANVSNISDMLINATLEYSLTVNVNGSIVPLGTQTSPIQSMTMCQSNVSYEPTPGIFNVIQNGEVKNPNTPEPYYFNIPTQVVNRVGNFSLEAMDPATDYNTTKAITYATDVNITMVNMAGFHYTNATCTDPDNSIVIGLPVSTHFNIDDTIKSISKDAMRSAAIFSTASQNAAFRIIFKDENNTTKTVCSRDNFAIRPESYSFKFTDYNHSNPLQQSFIIDNNGSTLKTAHLAAGYNYLLTMNATDHLNNTPVLGYTTSNLDANMTWQESTPLDCNNENNITLEHPFVNGVAETNTTWNNVGKYKLHISDTKWTEVDSFYLDHHTTPYFQTGTDCIQNSSVVEDESSASKNGCNISSVHHNNDYSQDFQDMLVFYHPYRFDLNATAGGTAVTPTIGLLFTPVPSTTPYIYMADINNTLDENMSYHLNGSITALGENNVTLTNFVDKCYAVPLDINISTSNRDLNDSNGNHVPYRIHFHDINSSGSVISALDINLTETNSALQSNDIRIQTVQTATKGYFPKNLNGTMQTRLNMNYVRKKETAVNPTTLTFIKYQVNCTNAAADCTFNADLANNKTTKGIKDLNSTIPVRHYYGRTNAPRTTINGSDGNVSVYYEVFCNGATCNKSLLQDGNSSTSTDDPRWFVNTKHTNDAGTAAQTATVQKNGVNVNITREANGNHPDYIGVHYNGSSGYPYKATMENNASGWLIYNKYNANATTNEFQVDFVNPNANWAGIYETNATTNKNASDKTNRRLMW
ncbi:DUF3344 domain-containing protein [Sulfurimonas sp. SWIR-19]|uniref:DUF3344 domain-containing protein n=1 Tax=Sulfurimonas sp. SWIR-19 TaxID=2878390 RepID=UPI001CF22243|nr:DUF3344 domain-containing protein [Sulfurimonas sp. SWIR-19]UCM99882.1 DUF3344 domain-containing protein [Sulfurimonas sp. SWIR-19]